MRYDISPEIDLKFSSAFSRRIFSSSLDNEIVIFAMRSITVDIIFNRSSNLYENIPQRTYIEVKRCIYDNMNNYPILIGIVVLFICVGFSGCNDLVGIDLSGIAVHSWKIEKYDNGLGQSVVCLAVNATVNRQNGAFFFIVLPNGTSYGFPNLVREKETATIDLPLGSSSANTFSAGTYTIVAYDTDYMYKKSPDPIFTKKISFNGATLSFLDWTVDQWGFYSSYGKGWFETDKIGYYIQDLTLKIKNIGDLPVRPTIKVQIIGKTDESIGDYILPNKEVNLSINPQIYQIPSGVHAAVIEIHYDDNQCILNKNFVTYQPRLSVSGFSTKWRYWDGSNDYSLYTVSMNIRNDGSLPFYLGDSEISIDNISGNINLIDPFLMQPILIDSYKEVQITNEVTGIQHVSSRSKTINIGIKDMAGNLAENYQSVSSPQEYIQFSLNSWDVLTNGYNIDLKLNYITNEDASVRLFDPSGNEIDMYELKPINHASSNISIPLRTVYRYNTPRGGLYTLQVCEYFTNFGSYTFRVAQRTYITISDPTFSANNFAPQWHQVYDNYQLTSFTLQIKNDGDLPTIIEGYVITIDGKDFSYAQGIEVPQGQQTITCQMGGGGPAWFAAGMHTITVRFSTENYGNGNIVGSYTTSITIP